MFNFLKKRPQYKALVHTAGAPTVPSMDWLARLRASLGKTRQHFDALLTHHKLDQDLVEAIEEALIMADCGTATTKHLITHMRTLLSQHPGPQDVPTAKKALAQALTALLTPLESPPWTIGEHRPWVILLLGVNGVGKTTSIGKLAHYFQHRGHSVLLAAGDTFRAAAGAQLKIWGERNHIPVIMQEKGEAASIIYDAITAAKARRIDIVLADTAGRLPTQKNLMAELQKIHRVIGKAEATAPHEVLLILDGTTGQNALAQVQSFDQIVPLTGLIMTKLDGSAKGGMLAAIAHHCAKPVRFIGTGEGIEDLQLFQGEHFAQALLD